MDNLKDLSKSVFWWNIAGSLLLFLVSCLPATVLLYKGYKTPEMATATSSAEYFQALPSLYLTGIQGGDTVLEQFSEGSSRTWMTGCLFTSWLALLLLFCLQMLIPFETFAFMKEIRQLPAEYQSRRDKKEAIEKFVHRAWHHRDELSIVDLIVGARAFSSSPHLVRLSAPNEHYYPTETYSPCISFIRGLKKFADEKNSKGDRVSVETYAPNFALDKARELYRELKG